MLEIIAGQIPAFCVKNLVGVIFLEIQLPRAFAPEIKKNFSKLPFNSRAVPIEQKRVPGGFVEI